MLNLGLAGLGTLLVTACSIEAWCRYTGSTPTLAQVLSAQGLLGPVSRVYEPGKGFGQIMGYLGGSLIFLTLAYPIRKHILRFGWLGSLKTWLDVHIFFGITGTAIITLHMAGHLNGIVALCYYATLMAFSSGVIGRFLYVHLPRQVSGREQEFEELRQEAEDLAEDLEDELKQSGIAWKPREGRENGAATAGGLGSDLRGLLAQRRGTGSALRALRRRLRRAPGLDTSRRRVLDGLARQMLRKQREVRTYAMARHLFASWHKFHLPFTYMLFGILAIHVTVAYLFYVGN
jgi:hypothetical protein